MMCAGTARPRVGLLGNPSDGYGGKVISFTFEDFEARVTVEDCGRVELGIGGTACIAGDWDAAFAQLAGGRLAGGAGLLCAALEQFRGFWAPTEVGLKLRFESDIPRQVGLAGSSAIVLATLRALARRFDADIDALALADLALRAETEGLGIRAGPQDRIVQSLGGTLFMDFAAGARERVVALDPNALPPLFIAWIPGLGESSGKIHDVVRHRWERGDPDVIDAMRVFPGLAREGRACLERGNHARFADLVDANYDARAAIWELAARDRELVAIGRRFGAAVKFCGSGGSVVGVLRDAAAWPAIENAYQDAGYRALRPRPEGAT